MLLRKYKFELLSEFPEPDYDSMVVGPKEGKNTVRYTKIK